MDEPYNKTRVCKARTCVNVDFRNVQNSRKIKSFHAPRALSSRYRFFDDLMRLISQVIDNRDYGWI